MTEEIDWHQKCLDAGKPKLPSSDLTYHGKDCMIIENKTEFETGGSNLMTESMIIGGSVVLIVLRLEESTKFT